MFRVIWKERCPQGILTSVLYLVDSSGRRDVHRVCWHLYCTLWTSLEGEMSTRYPDICTVPCGHIWKERCPQGILTSVLYLVDISRRRDVHKVSWHLYCTLWTSLEGEMSTRYLDICTVPCGHIWKERCPQGILTSVLYLEQGIIQAMGSVIGLGMVVIGDIGYHYSTSMDSYITIPACTKTQFIENRPCQYLKNVSLGRGPCSRVFRQVKIHKTDLKGELKVQ